MARSATMNVMIKAVEKAARGLKRDFGEVENLQVSRKGPGDFVTTADKKSEETLYAELSKARPTFAFLMEESGQKGDPNAEDVWVIDPLDGTSNFIHGMPHWAISVTWLHKGEPQACVIFDPIKDEMFFAERGFGAFMNSRRLRVSARKEAENCLAATEISRVGVEEQKLWGARAALLGTVVTSVRRTGSTALDLAYVAAGRFDFFWHPRSYPWDFAGGILLIHEAGGMVSRLDGKKLTKLEPSGILASNGKMHRYALEVVGEKSPHAKTTADAGARKGETKDGATA